MRCVSYPKHGFRTDNTCKNVFNAYYTVGKVKTSRLPSADTKISRVATFSNGKLEALQSPSANTKVITVVAVADGNKCVDHRPIPDATCISP